MVKESYKSFTDRAFTIKVNIDSRKRGVLLKNFTEMKFITTNNSIIKKHL